MEKSRPALVNIDDQKIVSAVAGGMHTVCLTNKGEVGDLLMQLHVYIFVRLGTGSFNVLSVLNVVVHTFNCIHKSRYHSFYVLYDTVYTFVMTRTSVFMYTVLLCIYKDIRVFMYIYCSLFYFVLTRTSEFSCTYIVHCFRCTPLAVMMRGLWEGIHQKKAQRPSLVRLTSWGGASNCRREIATPLC